MADNDQAHELQRLRIEAMEGDATLVALANGRGSSFVEADLVYQDLSAPDPHEPVTAHLQEAGGEVHTEAEWKRRTSSSAGKDVAAYLDHVRHDLLLEIWDFGAARARNSALDVRDVAAAVRDRHPDRPTQVHHVPVYSIAPLSFGPFGSPAPVSPGDAGPAAGVSPGTGGPAPAPPSPSPGPVGAVRLAILDTGIPPNFAELHPRLAGAVAPGRDDEDPYDADGDLRLDAGHGLFILDIAHRLAPSLMPAYLRRPARTDSNLTLGEHLIALDLWDVAQRALATGSRLIVNMSFSAPTADDRPGQGLLRELNWLGQQGSDVLVVVAAGNNGDDRVTFPAALDLPNVVSVGALDGRGQVAPFSSRGAWVDCWTTGTGIVGGYLNGVYDHPRGYRATFPDAEPMARWSGTSFAAPRVAAAIALQAATMPGATLVAAWEALRQENRDRHPEWADASGRRFTEHGVVVDI